VEVKTQIDSGGSLVIGGTGLVGGYIVEHLLERGEHPLAMSRTPHPKSEINWIHGDLRKPDELGIPPFATLYCTADATLLANALPRLLNPSTRRVVAFSSTSVVTKQDTEVSTEREMIKRLTEAERTIAVTCEKNNVGWTILRPTLIYAEGRDTNITPLSRLIRRFGFMPLVGGAPGLRQPVHAEDLAVGAINAAASPAAANKNYSLPGAETLAYHEMIGRIFDGLRLPRRTISVPPLLWRAAFVAAKPLFPGANVAMGIRMMKDMTFDSGPAVRDIGWSPRAFNPVFEPEPAGSPIGKTVNP
jgi:nucleoside-diphosphate-sugar epimerase